MIRFVAALTLGLVTGLVITVPASAQRQRLSMDPGWRFTLGDPAGADQPGFDDHQWRRLDLPHDWSIEGTPTESAPAGGRGGYFPTGIGWYRKAFRMPAGSHGQMASLEFDGVYMNSDVWINGFHLGKRPYGYISFAYDISQHLVSGVNVIAVRVDNSHQPNSRWYSGSGIYRHVWLTLVNPVHVGHWGVYVTTPRVDSTSADVLVRTRIEAGAFGVRQGVLRSTILDGAGRDVAHMEAPFSRDGGPRARPRADPPSPFPSLWSVETPTQYTLLSEVVVGGRAVDVATTHFGIRTIAFDKDRGFLLNGRRVKLRGVNLHGDGGAVGTAVPERIWEERLASISRPWARTQFAPPTTRPRLSSWTSATGWGF